MPKTDTEWWALSTRIGREIIGLFIWDDLTAAEQQSYIDVVPKAFLDMSMKEWKRSYWQRKYGSVFTVDDYSGWQPHKDVAQAMEALEVLRTKGCWSSVRMRGGAQHGKYKPYICRLSWDWDSKKHEWRFGAIKGDNLTKTICLAIELWLEDVL